MTNKNVLIVASVEGFMTKGLETKLRGIGMETIYSSPNVMELGGKCKDLSLVVIFTDEEVMKARDTCVYLRDYCKEHEIQAMLIGKREENESYAKTFTETLIAYFYERPLDMDKLLNDVEKYMVKVSEYAKKKSILIVDDDVAYMSMIMDWLKNEYRISLANSGMEAITWLATNKPDLILLDYEMPVISGPQVLEMIRSNSATSSLPVMFLTGKGDKQSVMKVLSLKPVGYLLKSLDITEVHSGIAAYFESVKKQ